MSPDPTVAVVTGAGGGIGRAVALRLARQGMAVVAVGRRVAAVEETASLAGDGVVARAADVSRAGDVAAIVEAARGLGRLHAWVNNAAVVERRPFSELDEAGWDRVMATNLRGVFLCCRAAFAEMAARGGGVIVNLGSLSGVANVEKFPGLAAYNVSKAGVIALTEAVALEGRAAGVRCLALSPGAVDTEMLRQAAPHLRPGVTPEDVAAIVAWMLGDEAAPLSGSNVPLFSNA